MSEGISADQGARCALHPERAASGTCERCGNFACAECVSALSTTGVFCTSCVASSGASRYHVVPIWRFVLFSLLSSGLYQVYWFWKSWSSVKREDNSDIWPIARAIFAGYTYFSLISDINTQFIARERNRRVSMAPAVAFLITSIAWRLLEHYSLSGINCLFVVPALRAARELASSGALAEAARWRTRHTVLVIAGVVFQGLVLVSQFLPEATGE